MSRTFQAIAFLLAALWLPATLHCRLEAAGITSGLVACHDDEHADADCADGCATDSCDVVEGGAFRAPSNPLAVSAPVLVATLDVLDLFLPEANIVPVVSVEETHAPPELRHRWQFVVRAALSPRAPSLVS